MSTAKELLAKIKKALFDDMTPPPPAPAPLAPPVGTPYTLQDGSQISIVQAGDTPAIGDVVTIAGALAPAASYTLQDGSSLTTDATGTITAYTAATPVTTAVPAAAAAPVATPAPAAVPAQAAPKFEMTPENAAAMYESFGTGTPEEQIANLQVVCKALMEYNFGWQIREAQQKATADEAINIYKTDLIRAQTSMTSQKETIDKQDLKLKALFELVEQLVEVPTADPTTLTGNKKDKFSKTQQAEDKFKRIADGLKKVKQTA